VPEANAPGSNPVTGLFLHPPDLREPQECMVVDILSLMNEGGHHSFLRFFLKDRMRFHVKILTLEKYKERRRNLIHEKKFSHLWGLIPEKMPIILLLIFF
jgi:hypothetical protein